jgi:hypothetical protein
MVGAPTGLMRLAAACALAASVPSAFAATDIYVVTGSCRDGRPHGAYELRMQDGKLRVVGAFNQGKRIGSFLFWSSSGLRVALLPFDDDALNGTVALWYSSGTAKSDPRPKLEAAYASGLRDGSTRSWYPDGRPRTEFRYVHGVLAGARAWSARGASLAEAEARGIAGRDRAADEQFYNTLLRIVRDNSPICEAEGRKP